MPSEKLEKEKINGCTIYIDKCQYEIQERKKFRYGIPAYTGQFLTMRV
jgi:hypothetical protein